MSLDLTDFDNFNVSDCESNQGLPNIAVVGVGGAGGNIVNSILTKDKDITSKVNFIAINTDAQVLSNSICKNKIRIGKGLTSGYGAGSVPEIGKNSASESKEDIEKALNGAELVFIVAGMGGGTGTGAAPAIAKIARDMGAIVIAIITRPFEFEGVDKQKIAKQGVEDIYKSADTTITVSNQNLFRLANVSTTLSESFDMINNVVINGIYCFTSVMTKVGLINLDFADIKTIIANAGRAMIGFETAEGEDRAYKAANLATTNPLLDDVRIENAKGILVNISGGLDMTLFEVNDIIDIIASKVGDSRILFGAAFDESLGGKIRISLIAAGVSEEKKESVDSKIIIEEEKERFSGNAKKQQNRGLFEQDSFSKKDSENAHHSFKKKNYSKNEHSQEGGKGDLFNENNNENYNLDSNEMHNQDDISNENMYDQLYNFEGQDRGELFDIEKDVLENFESEVDDSALGRYSGRNHISSSRYRSSSRNISDDLSYKKKQKESQSFSSASGQIGYFNNEIEDAKGMSNIGASDNEDLEHGYKIEEMDHHSGGIFIESKDSMENSRHYEKVGAHASSIDLSNEGSKQKKSIFAKIFDSVRSKRIEIEDEYGSENF